MILVIDGEVQPREVALQIKSGKTYNRLDYCRIPTTPAHVAFWARHDLLTLGVVYDPSEGTAYWVDLQAQARAFQRDRQTPSAIRYRKSLWNRFDDDAFRPVLVPMLLKKSPELPLESALMWSRNADFNTHTIGVRVLLTRYFTEMATWIGLIDAFHNRSSEDLSYLVPVAFSKLLGNLDLSYTFTTAHPPQEVKAFAISSLRNIGRDGVAKLLGFLVEGDLDFSRGSLGRAIASVFEIQKDLLGIFCGIADDTTYAQGIRQMARDLHSAYSSDWRWYWD